MSNDKTNWFICEDWKKFKASSRNIPVRCCRCPVATNYTDINGHHVASLTHCDLVMPYGLNDPGHHWFRQWLVARLAPSHYLNCWTSARLFVNWTLRNQLQLNSSQILDIFIQENALFENALSKMAIIFLTHDIITSTQVMVYHRWIPCETLVHTGSR